MGDRRHGANDLFGDAATAAITEKRKGFFRAAIKALELADKPKSNTVKSRDAAHLAVAIKILESSTVTPPKKVMEARITKALGKMGIDAYTDRDSWQKLWKRKELAAKIDQARGNGRLKDYSGKGRAVESYDIQKP